MPPHRWKLAESTLPTLELAEFSRQWWKITAALFLLLASRMFGHFWTSRSTYTHLYAVVHCRGIVFKTSDKFQSPTHLSKKIESLLFVPLWCKQSGYVTLVRAKRLCSTIKAARKLKFRLRDNSITKWAEQTWRYVMAKMRILFFLLIFVFTIQNRRENKQFVTLSTTDFNIKGE